MRSGWCRRAGIVAAGLCAASAAGAQTPAPRSDTSGQVQSSPPPAQHQGTLSPAEIRELLDSAQATAKATRETVEYTRVMPDILTQILAKLDKIENKLDKIENAVKAGSVAAARRR